ncbi:hypothetical protein GJAV_G00250900 [Gymnothorax javanicus]|nr:hypothetical protein GJAV_G00250900 [Gymnothorax javanicus]
MPRYIFFIFFALCMLFGRSSCHSKDSIRSRRPRAVAIKRTNAGAVEASETEQGVGDLTDENHLHSVEDGVANSNSRRRTVSDPNHQGQATARAGQQTDIFSEGSGILAYQNVLNTLFAVYRPLLTRRFMDNLPRAVVCLLTGRGDCGLEGDIAKSIFTQLDQPIRSVLTSVKGLTCQNLSPDSRSFRATNFLHAWFDETTLGRIAAIQDLLLSSVVHLPQHYSKYFLTAWSVFSDATLPPLVNYISDFMVKILETPIDYFQIGLQFGIEIPVLDQNEQCHQGDLKQLIMWGMMHNGEDGSPLFLSCERRPLASLNNTLCANVLRSSPADRPAVFSLCQVLSGLAPAELELLWANGCGIISSVLAPFLDESTCSGNLHPSSRVSRSTLSLRDLMCFYSNWTRAGQPDPASVAFCADNDRESFLGAVCGNIGMIRLLATDPANGWVWGFCANVSGEIMVAQHCTYETWRMQLVDASVVSLCWEQDRERLERFLCNDLNFFLLVLSDPLNSYIAPNCSGLEPTAPASVNDHIGDLCVYSEWHNPAFITTDMVTTCVQYDERGFLRDVCTNSTFLAALLLNEMNRWVEDYCTISLSTPPTDPPATFTMLQWCDYQHWPERFVDPSVVGLCWQHDQAAFHGNVCCSAVLFEWLTQDPQNEWLMAVCSDRETLDRLPEVCRYGEWGHPIIVDMTDLAFCAEMDPRNFSVLVCANETVLQNLLANLDNTWLVQYCANHSGPGGRATLLALCWDYDQANFVSAICPDPTLLGRLTQEPSSAWVATLCNTYANMTNRDDGNGNNGGNGNGDNGNANDGNGGNGNTGGGNDDTGNTGGGDGDIWNTDGGNDNGNNNGGNHGNTSNNDTDPQSCLIQDLVWWLNWTCRTDLSVACHPAASRLVGLQLLVRCGAEVLGPRVGSLLPEPMASVVNQATSLVMVLLLSLEESHLTSLRITENIRLSVLESVTAYLEQEIDLSRQEGPAAVLWGNESQELGGWWYMCQLDYIYMLEMKVLTGLMQTGRDVTSDDYFLIKEYFRIPLHSLRAVLTAVDITTVRQILEHYSRNLETLQLPEEYRQIMMSALFGTHLTQDKTLFPHLGPLLGLLPPSDILSLPDLQSSADVLSTIDASINQLSSAQRRAFGKWLGRSFSAQSISAAGPSFIRDTGNLIAYLPFSSFQQLTPSQLLDGLDVLLRNPLSPVQKQFVAQSLVGTHKNLTTDVFQSLGNLTCLAEPEDLFIGRDLEMMTVIQENIHACVQQGMKLPGDMISGLFLNETELQSPASLSAERISQLGDFLPLLGVNFLRKLSPAQLRPALPDLATVPFSQSQAQAIVEKVLPSGSLALPGQLQELGTLVSGVKANAITTKLWGSEEVILWLDEVEPLLPDTPLLSVQVRASMLLTNTTTAHTRMWNTQQAKALFKEAVRGEPELSIQEFLALGTIAWGADCETLRWIFLSQPAVLLQDVLSFLRNQQVPLHTSLKKCIIEELYQFDFFSQLLGDLGSQIALELSVSTIQRFPAYSMDTLREMIVQDPLHFLRLPKIKQVLLVDKIVQRLSMYLGGYTEEEFRTLGVMSTFVVDKVFLQLDRTFFMENLDFLKGFCYGSSKRDIVAQILQEPGVFGPVESWTSRTLDQVGRFLFFLPREAIQRLPAELMRLERIERLFISQQQWEEGEFGSLCVQSREQQELEELFARRQFVLQYFLGFLGVGQFLWTSGQLIPSCENLHATQPSAWSIDSLMSMPVDAFASCLELIGQDPFLTPYDLGLLLSKVKEIYGPASTFSPLVISQLGRLASQLTDRELAVLQLSYVSTFAALGSISSWNSRQLPVLFLSVLNSTKQSPSQLDSSSIVALGHIVCGIRTTDMRKLNAVEFSKAVQWLGRLRLSCSEEQLLVLVGLLSHSLAFGPISSWGSEVFIEIGVLAAGLPDIAMSALVRNQIEGITPLAISVIPADKFAVVFNQAQIRMFSYEQAIAVTESQRSALSPVQQIALSMVLTPWENRPVDFRGRSSGIVLHPGPFSLLMEVLILMLLFAHCSF